MQRMWNLRCHEDLSQLYETVPNSLPWPKALRQPVWRQVGLTRWGIYLEVNSNAADARYRFVPYLSLGSAFCAQSNLQGFQVSQRNDSRAGRERRAGLQVALDARAGGGVSDQRRRHLRKLGVL